MAQTVTVWYDEAGDYLEVLFPTSDGYFRETDNGAVSEKVDNSGRLIGSSILKIQALKGRPSLKVALKK